MGYGCSNPKTEALEDTGKALRLDGVAEGKNNCHSKPG
jgi:hypothetical protein